MDKKQYIDDDDGLALNHTYTYIYGHQRFEITLKNVFDRMVYEINKSVEHFSFEKKDYKIKLNLEIIPRGVKVK